jgi:VanZ family protein
MIAPWLLVAVTGLIMYGSLYPFDFKPDAVEGGVLEAWRALSWARAGRGDRISNILLYVPFGFCALLWLEARLRRPVAAILAILAGTLLSLTVEVAQVYVSPRVPSLMDLSLNTAGTVLGVIAGAAWRALGEFVYVPAPTSRHARSAAIALVVAFLAWRLAPFVPELDLAKLKAALTPLFRPDIDPGLAARFLVSWLVVAQALFAISGRERGLDALLALIATVLVARLLLATQAFVPAELLALLLVLPGLVVLNGLRHAARTRVLLAAVCVLLTAIELAPFAFEHGARAFDLWPFLGWIDAGCPVDLEWLLERAFVYAALAWLLREIGLTSLGAAIGTLVIVLTVEVASLWQPTGNPGLTRPALAVLVLLAIRVLESRSRHAH